jgi:hypothetical protein
MAFNNLTPISIGDGDPVTADVLRKIVENINIIAKGETVTPVQISSTTINGGKTISARGLETTIGSIINIKSLNDQMKSFLIPFGELSFTETPVINVTLEFASAADSALYVPSIISATKTGFRVICKSPSKTKTINNAKLHWTASGTLDPKA